MVTTPDPGLVGACERAEMAAFTAILGAAPPALAASIGLVHTHVAGALAIASRGREKRSTNHVFSLGQAGAASPADLDALEAFCAAAGAPSCRVGLAPGPHAAPIEAALAARGFAIEDHWLRLGRDAAAPAEVPEPFAVRELAPAAAAGFGELLADEFGHPPEMAGWFARLVGRDAWRCFGAYHDGAIVACAALFLAGDTAWLGLAATRAEYRRHGAQSSLIARRAAAAREAGARLLVVETAADTPQRPNPSTHNLRRLGFLDLYERPTWVKRLVRQ